MDSSIIYIFPVMLDIDFVIENDTESKSLFGFLFCFKYQHVVVKNYDCLENSNNINTSLKLY